MRVTAILREINEIGRRARQPSAVPKAPFPLGHAPKTIVSRGVV
jgi:hypothetical protein